MEPNAFENSEEIEIRKTIRTIWASKAIILACILIWAVAAAIYLHFAKPIYESKVVFTALQTEQLEQLNQSRVSVGLQILEGSDVLGVLVDALSSVKSRTEFEKNHDTVFTRKDLVISPVNVRTAPGIYVLKLRNANREKAKILVEEYFSRATIHTADLLLGEVDYASGIHKKILHEKIFFLREQKVRADKDNDFLNFEINRLQSELLFLDKLGKVVAKKQYKELANLTEHAQIADRPIAPKRELVYLLALLIGLGSGIGLTVLRESRTETLRNIKSNTEV